MSEAPALRVVIADDTPDIRELLRLILGSRHGFDVVGEAADGREAIAQVEALQPDALVLDLAMPEMDGLAAIPEILRVSPDTRIVVLSGFDASVLAAQALDRGAHAYLTKGTPASRIAEALVEVCGGGAERSGNHAGYSC